MVWVGGGGGVREGVLGVVVHIFAQGKTMESVLGTEMAHRYVILHLYGARGRPSKLELTFQLQRKSEAILAEISLPETLRSAYGCTADEEGEVKTWNVF